MRAIQLTNHGSLDMLEEVDLEIPEPKNDEVLVKVAVSGINFADIYLRLGRYPMPSPFPLVPGLEVAGTVEQIGHGVTNISIGDRVMAFISHGGYAQYAVVKASQVLSIPGTIAFDKATALLVQGLTAVGLLNTGRYNVALILAATGGVGSILVQVAKNRGLKVIAAVGSESKKSKALSIGANFVVTYADENWISQIKEIVTEDIDVIFDANGGTTGRSALDMLSFGGTFVVYGSASGNAIEFTGQQILFKNQTVRGYSIYGDSNNAQLFLNELIGYYQNNKLEVQTQCYAFNEIKAALADLEAGKTQGKVLILHP